MSAKAHSRLAWYHQRLAAMSPAEIRGHAKKKLLQMVDARRRRDWTCVPLKPGQAYPHLPNPKDVPESLRATLHRDMEAILAGKWLAFGHLPIQVSDPPEWHKDYLAGVALPANTSAFKLNHRELPNGADIKLIWELSRWYSLTRLALAAFVLDDTRAATKCVHWLEHWDQRNTPYRGWNWTSPLESGMRLIQFTWIDALLQPFVARGELETEIDQLRYKILPSHIWFTWRHKSFGSSANNHLLGELAGLIVATVRWPALTAWGAPLEELHRLWEREVLAQFAEDGGNREQALHYHLFSFELCWHSRNALRAAGRTVAPAVEEQLALASDFFLNVQSSTDHWDYGDSDDAFVLPIATDAAQTTREWLDWMQTKTGSLGCFLGEASKSAARAENLPEDWRVFRNSGIAVNRTNEWMLRWDVSPLGFLSTAAHGHFDALHLSLWLGGVAMIIDPGTGAYYADPALRNWLASRQAHNGPAFEVKHPLRTGPFLWSGQHAPPTMVAATPSSVAAEVALPEGMVKRSIHRHIEEDGWVVEDEFSAGAPQGEFAVLWQFAPETVCEVIESRQFRITRQGRTLAIRVSANWDTVNMVTRRSEAPGDFQGTVSPHFRQTVWAPYLKLMARPQRDRSCTFQTVFLALRH